MKYRIDFVTNSSSSSFLFQKNSSLDDIKKEVLKELKGKGIDVLAEYAGFNDSAEYGIRCLKSLEIFLHKAENLSRDSFHKIFSWYSDEVLTGVFGLAAEVGDFWEYAIEHDFSEQEFSTEQLNMIFIYLVLCIVLNYKELDLNEKISYSVLEDIAFSFISREIILDEWLYDIFIDNYEKGVEFLHHLDKTPIQLLQDFLDFDYVYYAGIECNYLLAEVLLSVPSCVHGCSHMG